VVPSNFVLSVIYDLALFYNLLEDFINEAPAENNPDIDFSYKNTNAKIYGGEISISHQFDNVLLSSNILNLGFGGSYVYGLDLSEKSDAPLFGMPPIKASFNLAYKGFLNANILSGYIFKFEAEYAAAQNRVASIPDGTEGGPWGYLPSESHLILNFSLGLNSNNLPGYPRLRFIINNLFNSNYQPFGSYIPAIGRNIKTIVSFNF